LHAVRKKCSLDSQGQTWEGYRWKRLKHVSLADQRYEGNAGGHLRLSGNYANYANEEGTKKLVLESGEQNYLEDR